MKLDALLQILKEYDQLLQTQALEGIQDIAGKVCTDNREIQTGDVFICIKGFKQDGHSFIPDARRKNAALIVCESEFPDSLPAIRVKDGRKAAALLAKVWFHNPSSQFRLVGVTGTNGKTTTSMLLFKAIRELGIPAGWIGTLGYYINEEQFSTMHTTPDIMELNRIFAEMAAQKVQYVIMEVSSHAIALDRVYGVEFDYCLFTNLSREHLDFHLNMEEYGATKLRLFESAIAHKAVALINIDDSFGLKIYADLKAQDAYIFSVGSTEADFQIRLDQPAHKSSWEQSRFALQSQEGVINLRSPLIGGFNIANLALSAATMSVMGFELRQIAQGLNSVKPVAGRFERIENERGIGVFVDYAHTPDALENVLKASRDLEHGRVLCMFGAGGDRDKGKRPLMLKAALKYADAVILTDDNPRTEDPNQIIRDIVSGCELWLPWWIIRDRRKAIRAILALAQPGDIVLLCGKGHETYQEIEGVRHHFDDAEVARECFSQPVQAKQELTELVLPVDKLLLEILYNLPALNSAAYQDPITYKYISTDSRTLKPGSVFFALTGANFDGHEYIKEVLKDPSNIALGQVTLAERSYYKEVSNSQSAMGDLLRKYLLMFDVYKIALTGSTGKSSTKELLEHIFSTQAPTLKTEANENNLIGLCKTIQRIKPSDRYAIFELGTNAFGEIATLSDICAPDAAMILNIGPSHLEYLVDEEGVFKEKSALFNRSLDVRLYDADDPRFAAYRAKGKGVGMSEGADFRISAVSCDNYSCAFSLNDEHYELPYSMPYMVKNSSFAIAMGILAGIPVPAIKKALQDPVRLDLRMQIEILEYCILVADCYNANPVSMQSALEYWHKLAPDQYHVAILGDMLELGSQAAAYHDMIGAILAETGYDCLITVGELAARYHGLAANEKGLHFATVQDLIGDDAVQKIRKGSVILVKASHSIHLEKVLPIIRNRC